MTTEIKKVQYTLGDLYNKVLMLNSKNTKMIKYEVDGYWYGIEPNITHFNGTDVIIKYSNTGTATTQELILELDEWLYDDGNYHSGHVSWDSLVWITCCYGSKRRAMVGLKESMGVYVLESATVERVYIYDNTIQLNKSELKTMNLGEQYNMTTETKKTQYTLGNLYDKLYELDTKNKKLLVYDVDGHRYGIESYIIPIGENDVALKYSYDAVSTSRELLEEIGRELYNRWDGVDETITKDSKVWIVNWGNVKRKALKDIHELLDVYRFIGSETEYIDVNVPTRPFGAANLKIMTLSELLHTYDKWQREMFIERNNAIQYTRALKIVKKEISYRMEELGLDENMYIEDLIVLWNEFNPNIPLSSLDNKTETLPSSGIDNITLNQPPTTLSNNTPVSKLKYSEHRRRWYKK